MASMGNSFDDEDLISGINVTPLVDVALVLLIIFIATSAILVRAAIQVDLPSVATAGEALPSTVSIVLDRDRNLFLNGEPITRAQLRAAVGAEVADDPQLRALIAADSSVHYGAVMELIDLVRQVGVAGFSLNVEPAREEE
ncbi:MAG: biopolymer transporter ExbD [Bradymonadales bacterium]|nr:biopolymer transporter ExbD [Bradymonadales bacterium]